MYKIINENCILRESDGAFIAKDLGNSDYLAYLAWVDNGNTPAAKETKEEITERIWGLIKQKREEIKDGGVFVSGKWFHTDSKSRIQQLGLVIINGSIQSGIMWKTMDGSFIEMTNSIATQLLNAVSNLDIAAHTCAQSHRVALLASNNPANYDFSTGWPEVYS